MARGDTAKANRELGQGRQDVSAEDMPTTEVENGAGDATEGGADQRRRRTRRTRDVDAPREEQAAEPRRKRRRPPREDSEDARRRGEDEPQVRRRRRPEDARPEQGERRRRRPEDTGSEQEGRRRRRLEGQESEQGERRRRRPEDARPEQGERRRRRPEGAVSEQEGRKSGSRGGEQAEDMPQRRRRRNAEPRSAEPRNTERRVAEPYDAEPYEAEPREPRRQRRARRPDDVLPERRPEGADTGRRRRRGPDSPETTGERRRGKAQAEGRRRVREEEAQDRETRSKRREDTVSRRFALRPLSDDELATNPWIEERDKPEHLRRRRKRRPEREPAVETREAETEFVDEERRAYDVAPDESVIEETYDERHGQNVPEAYEAEEPSLSYEEETEGDFREPYGYEQAPYRYEQALAEPDAEPYADVVPYNEDVPDVTPYAEDSLYGAPYTEDVPDAAAYTEDTSDVAAYTEDTSDAADFEGELEWDDDEGSDAAREGSSVAEGDTSYGGAALQETGDIEGASIRESRVDAQDVFALAWQRRARTGGRTFSDVSREREQALYERTHAEDFDIDYDLEPEGDTDVYGREGLEPRHEDDHATSALWQGEAYSADAESDELDDVADTAIEGSAEDTTTDVLPEVVGQPDEEFAAPGLDTTKATESPEQDEPDEGADVPGHHPLWTEAPNVGTVAQPSIPRVFLFEDVITPKDNRRPVAAEREEMAPVEEAPSVDEVEPVSAQEAMGEPEPAYAVTDEADHAVYGSDEVEDADDSQRDALEMEALTADEPEPEAEREPEPLEVQEDEDVEAEQEEAPDSNARGRKPSFFARVRESVFGDGGARDEEGEDETEPEDETSDVAAQDEDEIDATAEIEPPATGARPLNVPSIESEDEVLDEYEAEEDYDEDYEEDYEEDYDEEPEDTWYEPVDDEGETEGHAGRAKVSMPRPDHTGTGPVVSRKVAWQRSWKSRNLTDGRRRPKGRSHAFLVFYLLLVCALVGAGGFAFYHTYDSLVRYERSRASSFMDSLIDDLQAGGEVARRREASIVDSLALSAHDDLQLLNTRLDRGVAKPSYRLEQIGHTGDAIDPIYTLYVDDEPYLSMTLHARDSYVRMAMLPVTDWEISDAYVYEAGVTTNALPNPGGSQSLDISVAPDSVAYVNGQALTDEDLAENSGVLAGFEYTSQFVEVPAAKTYHVEGLHTAPEVWATDSSGNPVELEHSGNTYRATSLTVPNTEAADLPVDALLVAETWSRFQTADLGGADVNFGLGQVTSFLVPGSKLYNDALTYAKSVDITFVVSHTLDSFSEESVTNCVKYNDRLISCDVRFLKNMTLTATETLHSDVFDNTLVFAYIEDAAVVAKPGWYLMSMEPKSEVA